MSARSLSRLLLLPLALGACRGDITDTHAEAPLAVGGPLLAVEEQPRFSEWSTPVHLGTVLNTRFVDSDPFLSRDGSSLYFVAGRGRGGAGGQDLWVSHRPSGADPWGTPANIAAVNSAGHENAPTLSRDGHRLYFASRRPGGQGGFDLYVSRRRDHRDDLGWGPPMPVAGVNTSADETDLTFFEDEATGTTIAYVASDRPGGPGLDDIYTATVQPDGTFGPAVLVPELSTPSLDMHPAVRRDGLEIFLTSDRPGTTGNADIFVATRANTAEPWFAPVDLGPTINTAPRPPELEQPNDFRPALSFDGTTLYFAAAFRAGNVSDMFDLWVTTRSRVTGPGTDG
ncbi:MAG: hypothetical protein KY466_15230 [Gemmatimonadetes bacterium]|nr:hypothetical protein [Gemmatimonadota bacterium]